MVPLLPPVNCVGDSWGWWLHATSASGRRAPAICIHTYLVGGALAGGLAVWEVKLILGLRRRLRRATALYISLGGAWLLLRLHPPRRFSLSVSARSCLRVTRLLSRTLLSHFILSVMGLQRFRPLGVPAGTADSLARVTSL
jgi:hypothetical protein